MAYDEQKIDDAVLALLYLTLHDGTQAWKTIGHDALNRLYEKGYLHSPVGKVKSVGFTEEGLQEAGRLCRQFFARDGS